MPVADLFQLSYKTQVSPWFNLPRQADDDYQRRFIDYVHAHLDPKLVAHVELSNIGDLMTIMSDGSGIDGDGA
jgi:hypothetical protein